MNNLKPCLKCGTEKPDSYEYFCKENSGKISSLCRGCKSLYDKDYRLKNKENLSIKSKTYRESNKELIAKRTKAWREDNIAKIKQYRIDNKEHISQQYKQYRAERREELLEIKRKWTKENKKHNQKYRIQNKERDMESAKTWLKTEIGHQMRIEATRRRRERLKNLLDDFTNKDWRECLEHFNHSCAYCGEHTKLENDHFIAVIKGGHYTKSNILCSCRRCNASKDVEDFFIWYPLQDFYNKERENKILDYLNISGGEAIGI